MNDKIKMGLSVAAFVCAMIIGFIALFLPPQGVIDASVLWFTSQALVFTATLLGLNISMDSLRQIAKGGKQKHEEE